MTDGCKHNKAQHSMERSRSIYEYAQGHWRKLLLLLLLKFAVVVVVVAASVSHPYQCRRHDNSWRLPSSSSSSSSSCVHAYYSSCVRSVCLQFGCHTFRLQYSTVQYASSGWGSIASNACRGGWVTVLIKVILWYMGQINLFSPTAEDDDDGDDDGGD
jgi:hypothetical protein